MNLWTTTLRLNLDKPDHRKVCEILKSADVSHTKFIVSAVLAYAEKEKNNITLLSEISKIVKAEIGAALQNYNSEPKEIIETDNKTESKNEISYQPDVEEDAKSSETRKSVFKDYDENIDMSFLEM